VATGRGESGTALDYLRDLIAHLAALGIREPALAEVLAAAEQSAAGA
jgi:cation transport regulator ChaC